MVGNNKSGENVPIKLTWYDGSKKIIYHNKLQNAFYSNGTLLNGEDYKFAIREIKKQRKRSKLEEFRNENEIYRVPENIKTLKIGSLKPTEIDLENITRLIVPRDKGPYKTLKVSLVKKWQHLIGSDVSNYVDVPTKKYDKLKKKLDELNFELMG